MGRRFYVSRWKLSIGSLSDTQTRCLGPPVQEGFESIRAWMAVEVLCAQEMALRDVWRAPLTKDTTRRRASTFRAAEPELARLTETEEFQGLRLPLYPTTPRPAPVSSPGLGPAWSSSTQEKCGQESSLLLSRAQGLCWEKRRKA